MTIAIDGISAGSDRAPTPFIDMLPPASTRGAPRRHITVQPQQRESYLAGCVRVVEQARGTYDIADVRALFG